MSDGRWLFPPEGVFADGHEYLWSCEAERLAHDRWLERPLEERKAVFAARVGMMGGDLAQLAALIRAGFPIDRGISAVIADAIEGTNEDGFRLKLVLAKGHKSPQKKAQLIKRDFEIYWRVLLLRMEARSNGETGVTDAIFAQVADEFAVSLTTVKNAWRKFQL